MHMGSKVIVLALASIGIAIAGLPLTARPTKHAADLKLMEFMVDTQTMTKQNPQRSIECFNYYIPVLNNITAKYELDYYNCVIEADMARDKLNNDTAFEVQPFADAVAQTCGMFDSCAILTNTLDALRCYERVGSDSTKIMYDISTNATDLAGDIEQHYYVIELNQDRCTNATERAYIENTAATYDELQRCIAGEIPVPDIKLLD